MHILDGNAPDLLKKGKIANSFAYLDHCVASYLAALRRSPLWKETLVILVADHGIAWPDAISETRPDRYHIPLLVSDVTTMPG